MSPEIRPKNFGTFEKRTPGPCDAGAVFHQLRYEANWELVVMWVYDKPVGDEYRSIYVMVHVSYEIFQTFLVTS